MRQPTLIAAAQCRRRYFRHRCGQELSTAQQQRLSTMCFFVCAALIFRRVVKGRHQAAFSYRRLGSSRRFYRPAPLFRASLRSRSEALCHRYVVGQKCRRTPYQRLQTCKPYGESIFRRQRQSFAEKQQAPRAIFAEAAPLSLHEARHFGHQKVKPSRPARGALSFQKKAAHAAGIGAAIRRQMMIDQTPGVRE